MKWIGCGALFWAVMTMAVPGTTVFAAVDEADDLLGYRWAEMKTAFMGDGNIEMSGIHLTAPTFGENSAAVPYPSGE